MTTNQSPLRTAVAAFTAEHNRWTADRYRPTIDGQYIKSMRAVFSVLEAGDIPPSDRRLEIAALELAREWIRLESAGEDSEPDDAFWHHREGLERAYNFAERPLESVKQLHAQGVSEEQIARMWGLTMTDGSGDIESVAKEIANPGSVIRPGDVPLSRLREQRELDERRDEIAAEIQSMGEVIPPEIEPEPEPTRCPETPEQLFWQGVPVQQSAKMLNMPLGEVDRLWREFERAQERREKQEQLDRLKAELEPAEAK